MSRQKLIIGTRGSELARAQTAMMAAHIAQHTQLPIETRIIKTRGDVIQDVPLHQVDGKGFFTKEIEEALLAEEIDIAVHSMKDLPTECPAALQVAAIPEREQPNDLLLVRNNLDTAETLRWGLPHGAVVGTSSKRRALQIQRFRPDIQIAELRGNVPTRIKKLLSSTYDAIVLAASGYRRLKLIPEGYHTYLLGLDEMLPAPGQGALAIQIRANDDMVAEVLEKLHDSATALAVEAERAVLEGLGGGCGMPLGVYAQPSAKAITLHALLGPEDWQSNDAPRWVCAEATADDAATAAQEVVATLQTRITQ